MCFSTEAMIGLALFIFRSMVSPVAAVEPQPPVPHVAPKKDDAPLATPIARLEGCAGTVACFNADGSLLLTAGLHEARVWDAKTFKPIGEPVKFEHEILRSSFVADGLTVFTMTDDDKAYLWDAKTGKTLKVFSERDALLAVASADGSRIALTEAYPKDVGQFAGAVHVFDIKMDKEVASIQIGGFFDYLLLSPDGRTLVTAEEVELHTHTFHLWNLETGKEWLPQVKTRFDGYARGSDDLVPAAFSRDSSRVAILSGMGFVVYDLASGKKLADTIPANEEPQLNLGSTVAFTPDGAEVIVFKFHSAQLFSVRTGKPSAEVVKFGAQLYGKVLSADAKKFLGSYSITDAGKSEEQGAAIWDLRSGRRLKRLLSGQIGAMALSPDGHFAAAAEAVREGESCTLVWEVEPAE